MGRGRRGRGAGRGDAAWVLIGWENSENLYAEGQSYKDRAAVTSPTPGLCVSGPALLVKAGRGAAPAVRRVRAIQRRLDRVVYFPSRHLGRPPPSPFLTAVRMSALGQAWGGRPGQSDTSTWT